MSPWISLVVEQAGWPSVPGGCVPGGCVPGGCVPPEVLLLPLLPPPLRLPSSLQATAPTAIDAMTAVTKTNPVRFDIGKLLRDACGSLMNESGDRREARSQRFEVHSATIS